MGGTHRRTKEEPEEATNIAQRANANSTVARWRSRTQTAVRWDRIQYTYIGCTAFAHETQLRVGVACTHGEGRASSVIGYRQGYTRRPRYAAKRIHYGQLYKRLDAAALKLYARPEQADWIFRQGRATLAAIINTHKRHTRPARVFESTRMLFGFAGTTLEIRGRHSEIVSGLIVSCTVTCRFRRTMIVILFFGRAKKYLN